MQTVADPHQQPQSLQNETLGGGGALHPRKVPVGGSMAVIQKAWLASASAQLEADFPTVSSGALLKVLRQQMSKRGY